MHFLSYFHSLCTSGMLCPHRLKFERFTSSSIFIVWNGNDWAMMRAHCWFVNDLCSRESTTPIRINDPYIQPFSHPMHASRLLHHVKVWPSNLRLIMFKSLLSLLKESTLLWSFGRPPSFPNWNIMSLKLLGHSHGPRIKAS